MDTAIEMYRRRREERLERRGIKTKYNPNWDAPLKITSFQRRRDDRLEARGLEKISEKYDIFRQDAPGDDDDGNNNNNKGGGGGGHGNTRLPFGLCLRYGIDIGADWTPRDAWDALAGKGITPDSAYGRLKEGKDPGAPDVPGETEETNTPKVPSTRVVTDKGGYTVAAGKFERGMHDKEWALYGASDDNPDDADKTIARFGSKSEMLRFLKEQGVEEFMDPDTGEMINPKEMEIPKTTTVRGAYGSEYGGLGAHFRSWASRGTDPWVVTGKKVEGTGDPTRYTSDRFSKTFPTKEDMLLYLKKKGIEEFKDESGDFINPMEVELPPVLMEIPYDRAYTSASIGMRGEMYTIMGKDLAGKTRKIDEYSSLVEAYDKLKTYGVNPDDVKLSPALKKRETERTSWLTSGRKEYFEEGGKKYGDLKLDHDYRGWHIVGEAEDGEKRTFSFFTKAEAMRWLKNQNIEKVRFEKERLDPREYEIPPTIATADGIEYQAVEVIADKWGDISCWGTDLDGTKRLIARKRSYETPEDLKKKIADKGIPEGVVTMSEETKQRIAEAEEAERERKRRREEFESKAIAFGSRKVTEPWLWGPDRDGDFKIKGYDEDGDERDVTGYGDMVDMVNTCKMYGIDPTTILKNDEVKKLYEDFVKAQREFESKAVTVDGRKYAGVSISYDGHIYHVRGYDERGKLREPLRVGSAEELEEELQKSGFTTRSFPVDEAAKKQLEKAAKVKELVDSGEYYRFGAKENAFKDLRAIRDADTGDWSIRGIDAGGDDVEVTEVSSWDEAISAMVRHGVKSYKVFDGEKEVGMPENGIHSVTLMKKPGGGYVITAATNDAPRTTVYETNSEDDARAWLRSKHIPDAGIKTRGMNPNDDVVRTHTAKSLENFDVHRAEKADDYRILKGLSEQEKKDTAEMLTEMFQKGAFRMNRHDHFEEIVDDHFKNLLEAGTSGGSSYKPGRRATEEKTFGMSQDLPAHETEKYGYWGLDDDLESQGDSTAKGYGKIAFKFRKDKVGDRTTYTMGDSLDAGRPLAGYAGDHPTIEGVSAFYDKKTLTNMIRKYKEYKNGEISYRDFYDYVNEHCQDEYVECQFHGPLTIADVESITFPKRKFESTFVGMDEEGRKRRVQKLKDNGVILRYEDGGKLYDGYEWLEKKFGGS